MAVSSVGGNYANTNGLGATSQTTQAPSSSEMDMDSFMQLLAIQLENQDMNNPMSNSEMMQQLTSMATVQSMNTFSELSSTQYALNLMGQEVTVARTNELTGKLETKEGKIEGINISTMKVYLEGDKAPYGLGNIMEVGKVPDDKDKEDKDEDGEDDKPPHGTVTDPDKKPETPTPPDEGKTNNSNVRAAAYMAGAPENRAAKASTLNDTSQTSKTSDSGNTTARRAYSTYFESRIRTDYLAEDKMAALERQFEIPEDKKAALADNSAQKATGPAIHSV